MGAKVPTDRVAAHDWEEMHTPRAPPQCEQLTFGAQQARLVM
jgi:hypothetical protein